MSFAGFQLGSSAGYSQSKSNQTTSIKEGETAQMNISYNVSSFVDAFFFFFSRCPDHSSFRELL